jgi:hypothetical protein
MIEEKKTAVDIILELNAMLQKYGTPEELAEIDKELREELPIWVPLGSLERAVMLFLIEQTKGRG